MYTLNPNNKVLDTGYEAHISGGSPLHENLPNALWNDKGSGSIGDASLKYRSCPSQDMKCTAVAFEKATVGMKQP